MPAGIPPLPLSPRLLAVQQALCAAQKLPLRHLQPCGICNQTAYSRRALAAAGSFKAAVHFHRVQVPAWPLQHLDVTDLAAGVDGRALEVLPWDRSRAMTVLPDTPPAWSLT